MAIPCFVIQAGLQEIWPDGGGRTQITIAEEEVRMDSTFTSLKAYQCGTPGSRRKRKSNLHQALALQKPNQI